MFGSLAIDPAPMSRLFRGLAHHFELHEAVPTNEPENQVRAFVSRQLGEAGEADSGPARVTDPSLDSLRRFLAFGVAFEVPVAVIILARLGVVTIEQLRNFRRYFWVAAAAAAGLVTPPDAVSMIALLLPMGLLYEAGIFAAQFFIKHTKAPPEPAPDAGE